MNRVATASENTGFDIAAFLRAATHEIANPLNAISMNAELAKLLVQREQTPRAVEVLERLLIDCGRCARLLRDLQRFGSGLKSEPHEIIAARVLIDSAITVFSREFGTPPALHVGAMEQSIWVDRIAMERVIAGLLLNAVQAGATAITIDLRHDAGFVCIDISDNGRGIPAEIRARVTEPFFTTQRAEGREGFGLTLAQATLQAHGGDLRVDESDQGGARVVLRLKTKTREAT